MTIKFISIRNGNNVSIIIRDVCKRGKLYIIITYTLFVMTKVIPSAIMVVNR